MFVYKIIGLFQLPAQPLHVRQAEDYMRIMVDIFQEPDVSANSHFLSILAELTHTPDDALPFLRGWLAGWRAHRQQCADQQQSVPRPEQD